MRSAAGLLVVVGLALAVGCVPPKKRQFNNLLAKLNQDLSAKAKEFYKVVAPLEKGQNVSQANARTALEGCKTALKDVQEVFDGTGSPVGSTSGRAMRAKYADFLKAQHKIISDCFVPIVEAVGAPKLTPAEKWKIIQPLI